MATNLTQTTFLSQYNDDFRDSDHYHRILFNNGRHLQARELTQMQSILQGEIQKVASYLFKEGGIFGTSFGAINSGVDAIGYVKVTSLPVGYAQLKDLVITNASGIAGSVKAVIPAADGDPDTLLIKYVSSNGLEGADTTQAGAEFKAGETLSFDDGAGFSGSIDIQTVNTANNRATGKGSFAEVPQYNTFVAGHLILVESQSIVISKYDPNPTEVIGFKLVEEVVTVADSIALYDNSGTTPNLTSPGADRYRITLDLIKQTDLAAEDTFYPLYDIRGGEAVALRTADNTTNEIGSLIASRTKDQLGDFIVSGNSTGEMGLTIEADSEQAYLLYKIDGGTAFIDGNRLEREEPTKLRIKKARQNPEDLYTKENEFISAPYGSYVVADSAHGLIGSIDTLAKLNLYDQAQRSGTQVGTARIRGMDEFDNQFRIHLFDLEFDSDGTGSDYGIRDVHSFGTSASNFANVTPIDGKFDLFAREENMLLFPMPRQRVHQIDNVTAAVGKVYTATAAGGQATFSTGNSNTFADQEQWIVSTDSSGDIISPPTVSGTPNTSAVVTGLPNGATTLFAYENQTLQKKTKTLTKNRTQSVALTDNEFTLDRCDIYLFRSVVDDTTGTDITSSFIFDNGQRDNFYTVGSGRLKTGTAAPAGNVTVTYDFFEHSTTTGNAGYFAGKSSYPDIGFRKIPRYVASSGKEYRLSDVIDMRPMKDTTGANFTGSRASIEAIPRNTASIEIGESKYWSPRVDIITLDGNNQLNVVQGDTGRKVAEPEGVPDDVMKLHSVTLNPFTFTPNDLEIYTYDNRGYQMGDIRQIERRVNNLEELTALTLSELAANEATVQDPNDPTLPDRVKLGITGDTFETNSQTDLKDNDYRAMLNKSKGLLTPMNFKSVVGMTYDSGLSDYVVRKGNYVFPAYDEEVMIDQSGASKAINVAAFEPTRVIGVGVIQPEVDEWVVRRQVDASYEIPENSSTTEEETLVVSTKGNPFEHDEWWGTTNYNKNNG